MGQASSKREKGSLLRSTAQQLPQKPHPMAKRNSTAAVVVHDTAAIRARAFETAVDMMCKKCEGHVNGRRADGATAIWWAVWSASVDVLTILLARGADSNLAHTNGQTGLYLAAARRHERMVGLLLAHDARATDGIPC